MDPNMKLLVERQADVQAWEKVDTGFLSRLKIAAPTGDIVVECFIRGGRRGFQIQARDGSLHLSPAGGGIVEVWAEPWFEKEASDE